MSHKEVKMESVKVRDLMVPLEDYATVGENDTLYEAVIALEEAREKYDRRRYAHRAVLVLDKNRKVVGKLSQNDVIRSLEPRYDRIGDVGRISHWQLSPEFIKSMVRDMGLWRNPLEDICRRAAEIHVKDIMYKPAEGEYLDIEASLPEALHLLVIGHHQSLLVTQHGEVVGILRLTDVFMEVTKAIKTCRIDPEKP